jgi:3-oxoacyl-[acyl-carrier protein] reductase
VDAIVRRILPRRPLETWLPFRRGVLARVGDLFPGLSFALAPYLSRKGRKRQARLRQAGE